MNASTMHVLAQTLGYMNKPHMEKVAHQAGDLITELANALEFALALSDASGLADCEWQKYARNRWPDGWSASQIHKAEEQARATLAKVKHA